MLSKNSNSNGLRLQTLLGLFLTASFSLCAQATQEDKSALVDYGEHHPVIFIIGIFVVVAIAVVVVYFVFKRKEAQEKAKAAFSKPTQRTPRHPADRRYMSKKTMPR